MRPTRVLHLSLSDTAGGAARAAYRLHQGLLRLGLDSRMLVAQRRSADPTVQAIGEARRPSLDWLRRGLRGRRIRADFAPYKAGRPAGLEPFSDDRSRYAAVLRAHMPASDVVNLHFVAGLLDYGAFFPRVPRRVPVVWRLSDQNPFSGGCHYDEECGRYTAACGTCPQLGSDDPADLSHQIWRRKRAALQQVPAGRLHLVALNSWIAGEIRRSSLFAGLPVHLIPNGLDTTAYAPRDRAQTRAELGIPQAAKVVLFVAQSVDNRRKGFALLAEALNGMAETPDLFLVSIGRGGAAVDQRIPHLALGELGDDLRLSHIYSMADLFVIPSLQDNMPSTALEAISCGTPVVGFDVGGVPEMVRPHETGLLAPKGDVAGLRAAVRELLAADGLRREMGQRCRQIALAEYSQELQARRYAELYASLAGTTG